MTVTETRLDAKAGWSSYCRGDRHVSCKTIGVACSCTCHGPDGQEGRASRTPTPDKPKPTAAAPASADRPASGDLSCCGREFASAHGLDVHRARMHKTGAPAPAAAEPKPKARPSTAIARVAETPTPPQSLPAARSTPVPAEPGVDVRPVLADLFGLLPEPGSPFTRRGAWERCLAAALDLGWPGGDE